MVDYYVCTYVNPNNIGAVFSLGGQSAKDGGRVLVVPGQTYNISASPPSGYNFRKWDTARGVSVANPNSASTTVVFDASGWDGTCLGNLTCNYTSTAPTAYYVCTYVNPNNIGAYFTLGGAQVKDGQRAQVIPGQTYTLQANPPTGYSFVSWSTARGVAVANKSAASTTVVFDASGWDGMCLGNLTANYTAGTVTTPPDIRTTHFLIHFQGPIADGTGAFDFGGWLETAYSQISSLLGLSLSSTVTGRSPPFTVNIAPSSSCPGGIGGAAGDGQLSFCAGNWNTNRWTLGITCHEIVNLMTGECVTGGWPTDWWANSKSPFPALVSVTVLRSTGHGTEADQNEAEFLADPTYLMWKALIGVSGWTPVKNMFQLFRSRAINLASIAEPLKSAYVIVGLTLSGGIDLTAQLLAATGIIVGTADIATATAALLGGEVKSQIQSVNAPSSASADGVTVSVNVKNIGSFAGNIWCEALDIDTGGVVGARTSITANPSEVKMFTWNLTMPNKDFHLKVQAGH